MKLIVTKSGWAPGCYVYKVFYEGHAKNGTSIWVERARGRDMAYLRPLVEAAVASLRVPKEARRA